MSTGLNLDLSGAKESSFEALPAAWYRATIFDAKVGATKGGPTSKLPKDTPKIDVQYKIADGEFENRRVFASYIIAPPKVKDEATGKSVAYEHKGVMDGILFSFLKAAGFDTDALKSGSFDLNFDELKGRAIRIKLGQREYEGNVQNDVKGVKADTGETNDNLDLLS